MKLQHLNLKKHKLFIRWIETYLLLVVILAAVTVPIYLQSYQEVKNGVISDTRLSVEYGLNQLQNELNTYYAILDSLKSSREYKWMIDMTDVSHSGDYVHMASLQKYYKDLLLSSFIQEDTFIMFAQNDVVLSKYATFNDMEDFYGSILEFDGLTYDEMREMFFSKKYYGEFLSQVRFWELETKRSCDIVFAFTVSGTERSNGGAVLFSVYDTEKVISLLGLQQVAESGQIRLLNNQGNEILTLNRMEKFDGQRADLSITAPNSCITVEVMIPDSFYSEKLSATRNMLVMYALLFLILGIGMSMIFAYRNGRPLRNLVKLLSVDGDYPTENEYDYIRDYIKKLSHSHALTKAQMLDNMLVKLLFTGLNAKEQEEFKQLSDGHFISASMVLIKSNTINWEKAFVERLEEEKIPFYKSIPIDPFTAVVFFDSDSMDIERMNSILFDLNRICGFRLKGTMSTAFSLFPDAAKVFGKLRELIKYAEYCMFLTYDTHDSYKSNMDYAKGYFADSKLLREYLRSGNEFEANKIIYKQWYQLSINPGTNDDIANLFYYQTGILSEIIIDIGFEKPLPLFGNENDVLTNAVHVTQYIECLCDYINSRAEEGSQLDVEILKYINEHYYDSSFYLMTLSEEFHLSSRAVTRIVKRLTGSTFSEYLKKLRLSQVVRLLKETEQSVQEIATQSGFESANSLLKSFKKEYGVSPTEFRRNNRHFS